MGELQPSSDGALTDAAARADAKRTVVLLASVALAARLREHGRYDKKVLAEPAFARAVDVLVAAVAQQRIDASRQDEQIDAILIRCGLLPDPKKRIHERTRVIQAIAYALLFKRLHERGVAPERIDGWGALHAAADKLAAVLMSPQNGAVRVEVLDALIQEFGAIRSANAAPPERSPLRPTSRRAGRRVPMTARPWRAVRDRRGRGVDAEEGDAVAKVAGDVVRALPAPKPTVTPQLWGSSSNVPPKQDGRISDAGKPPLRPRSGSGIPRRRSMRAPGSGSWRPP
ncbi:hypothetical protein [Polyangium spumosum]|uniref:Uncharacterized protein n=1 Tax=Polyangium spumosum TaxID=889282 RepID=A0A6N7Q693_9BACT|nr:hypothetical protein [Polyangium spumosum]MRG97814.1 hypothetical protein [Polyangium spumosum]